MENKRIYPLTIILPTYNEEENMNIWLPEVISQLSDVSYLDFEILVVDDNSRDLTQSVVSNLILSYKNLRLITRLDEPSLSDSIYEGITAATKSNIMWLDADGSMDIESILKIISQAHEDNLESIYNNDVTCYTSFQKIYLTNHCSHYIKTTVPAGSCYLLLPRTI